MNEWHVMWRLASSVCIITFGLYLFVSNSRLSCGVFGFRECVCVWIACSRYLCNFLLLMDGWAFMHRWMPMLSYSTYPFFAHISITKGVLWWTEGTYPRYLFCLSFNMPSTNTIWNQQSSAGSFVFAMRRPRRGGCLVNHYIIHPIMPT